MSDQHQDDAIVRVAESSRFKRWATMNVKVRDHAYRGEVAAKVALSEFMFKMCGKPCAISASTYLHKSSAKASHILFLVGVVIKVLKLALLRQGMDTFAALPDGR